MASALPDITFVGRLAFWESFEREARTCFQQENWHDIRMDIGYHPVGTPGAANLAGEHVHCGNEGTIQGRFQAQVGTVLTAVSEAAGLGLAFGDYKATTDRISGPKIPDIAIMTEIGDTRAFGEVKNLPKVLAQIAEYLHIRGLKNGFVSTYDQTIFVKQELANGVWTLFYSPAIPSDAKLLEPTTVGGNPWVSLKECFWFLCKLAKAGHAANNPLSLQKWVR
ncbi:hypothetical protein BJX70DRAFT_396829 [Aspergillus crustosus]